MFELVLDPVAFIWVVSAGLLTLVSGLGVRNGIGDVRALSGLLNGRRIFAADYLRWQLAMFAVGLGWLYAGWPALLDERVTPPSEGVLALIGANVLLTLTAYLSRRARRRLQVTR